MKTPFEQAYEAYVARKQVERQLQLLKLREDLAASSKPSAPPTPAYGALKRPKGPLRPHVG
ncbi:MAG: hypothetical protein NVSMB30_20960 [Hymenobacter sp.]